MVDKQQLAAMGEHMREMEECKPEFKVPDGWKLVPEIATSEMIHAATNDGINLDGRPVWKQCVEVQAAWKWQQMLAAAPEYKT